MTTTTEQRPGTSVISRLLRVLSAIEDAPAPITVPEIAALIDAPLSSTYRLVGALKDEGRIIRLTGGTYKAVTESDRETPLARAARNVRVALVSRAVPSDMRDDLELLLAVVPSAVKA